MPGGMRLAIVASALNNDLRAAADAARKLDLSAMQLDAIANSLDVRDLSASGRRELRGILRGRQLDLVGLRLELGAAGLGPGADVDAILARLDAVMESSVGLAAPLVCIDLGPLPAPAESPPPVPTIMPESAGLIILPPSSTKSTPPPAPRSMDVHFADAVDSALAEVGRRADRYSVTLAFRAELAGFSALDRALRAAACPWFGIDLDPVALVRDDWTPDEIFSRLGVLIRHVRARDAVLGEDRRTRPAAVGFGSVRWEELLVLLDASGYHGFLTLDPMDLINRPAAAASGANFLRKLLPPT